jgi:hypothetical protein
MSGRSDVEYISGGKTVFSLVKSTKSFQSLAPSRIEGLLLYNFLYLPTCPSFTKEI